MSVLVRGMEMPENCINCQFCHTDLSDSATIYVDCEATVTTIMKSDYEDSEEVWEKLHDGRPEWCPLVEIEDGKLFAVWRLMGMDCNSGRGW